MRKPSGQTRLQSQPCRPHNTGEANGYPPDQALPAPSTLAPTARGTSVIKQKWKIQREWNIKLYWVGKHNKTGWWFQPL